ncbi:unnamed protein product [Phyllotreta striolata]|uniref:Lysosomal Pro-X carboxypeptidase n=1 Tax=Phyllotreta striolata TaxID=444603 RepID=A0A9N9TXJ1_PHYSR|nr:unnamed protein product [Phyllotreta striolata]
MPQHSQSLKLFAAACYVSIVNYISKMDFSFNSHKIQQLILLMILLAQKWKGAISYDVKYSLETRRLEVPVDHFSYLDRQLTFNIRYLISAKYHVKDGPVFVYTGGVGDIMKIAQNTGFLFDIAPAFNALIVFIEHRYYGQSLPFGNNSFASPEHMRYLTTKQALSDYVWVVNSLRKEFFESSVSRDFLPIIAFGGSYGGMLSAWLRIKYPNVVIGAISSSAPIFYFQGLSDCSGFYEKVTYVFEKIGHDQCIKTIKLGWDVIINLTKTKLGMDFISSTWRLCSRLRSLEDVEMLLDWLKNIYINMVLSNYHYPSDLFTPLPAFPVKIFCDKLTTGYFNDTKGLIEQFSEALQIYTNYTGTTVCNNINYTMDKYDEIAFNYQLCTELIMPKCSTTEDMFITKPWDYEKYSLDCLKKYGVKNFQPDAQLIEYGGKYLKAYSNIVFTTGNLDPYSCCGVSSNLSNTIYHYNMPDSPHLVDLRNSDIADNNYISTTRASIINAIKQFLNMV